MRGKLNLVSFAGIVFTLTTSTAAVAEQSRDALSEALLSAIESHSQGMGLQAFIMPRYDYANIPQDPNNPITDEKVQLGALLYHDTAFGTESTDAERAETYGCATCHHFSAGFKAGTPQGISDGGVGFGHKGRGRRLGAWMDAGAADGHASKPDLQPVATPTILNTAYQDVMLWNGALGSSNGSANTSASGLLDAGPGPIKANEFGLSGLETQVLAGTRLHRLRFDNDSLLQTNRLYQELYKAAYPNGNEGHIPEGSAVTKSALGAAKAIAAYERTVLANYAPFQNWLNGDRYAMSKRQLRGALLFFGKANCVACHTGPALSSAVGASADNMFFSIGFDDFDTSRRRIHGSVPEKASHGRGGFTGNASDNHKFKVPQLYNLRDTRVFGHGASFRSVREVIEYKNNGVSQNSQATNIAAEFVALNLTDSEVHDLTKFVKKALYDPWLYRYEPWTVPSGACFPAADFQSALDIGCF
ncbi:MAG: cytochrome c peroxidase [Granulosicoccus sp.]